MSVTLSQNTTPLTSDEIRMFLRDTVEENSLLDDIEHKKEDIDLAMKLTVQKWNAVTPVTSLTDPAQLNGYVLLCGVCGFLLKSEGLRQNRNQLTVQDGNVAPVGLDDKEDQYLKWASHFQNEFTRVSQQLKIQANMESILGTGGARGSNGLGSGYAWIGRYSY